MTATCQNGHEQPAGEDAERLARAMLVQTRPGMLAAVGAREVPGPPCATCGGPTRVRLV